jgi:hypothetical protein
MKNTLLLLVVLTLSACTSPRDSGVKVIVGARLDGPPAMEHSVIVIASGKIQAIGTQAAVPVPKGSEVISGLGMSVEPLPGDGPLKESGPADLVLKGAASRIMKNGEWVQ